MSNDLPHESAAPLAPAGRAPKRKTLREVLLSPEAIADLNAVSGALLTGERLANVLYACVSKTPMLAQCDAASLVGACKTLALMQCEPDGIHGYIVPVRTKTGIAALPVPSARGLLRLAEASGVSNVNVGTVRAGDVFSWGITGGAFSFTHVPQWPERGEIVGFFTSWRDSSGCLHGCRMTTEEVDAVRARSTAYRSGRECPWTTDYEQMALKTVIKRASKMWPIPTEAQHAMAAADESEFSQTEPRNVTPAPPPAPVVLRPAFDELPPASPNNGELFDTSAFAAEDAPAAAYLD